MLRKAAKNTQKPRPFACNEKGAGTKTDHLFESVTEYDIDVPKRYDMKFGGAKQLVLAGYDGEKVRVRLASNTLSSLQNDFKIKIDDIKNRIDVELIRRNGVTEAAAKEAVSIFVQIPSPYIGRVELAVNAETVEMHSLECDSVELELKTRSVLLDDVTGAVEINCNLDMNVVCRSLKGEIAMTPQTKCVETVVVTLAAVLVVLTNKEMFFERKHIGNLLHDSEEMQPVYCSRRNRSDFSTTAPAASVPFAASVIRVSVFQPFLGPALPR